MRDKHLLTPDFFDAGKYLTATFESTKTTLGDTKDTGAVTGKLTIRGITKEVTFKGKFTGSGPGPQGGTVAGFHASTTLSRMDFGVAYNGTLTNGMTMIGTDVELILDIEATEVHPAIK